MTEPPEATEVTKQAPKRTRKLVTGILSGIIVVTLAIAGTVFAMTAKNRAYDAAATAHNTAVLAAAEAKTKRIDLDTQLEQAHKEYTEKTLPAITTAVAAPEALVTVDANANLLKAAETPREINAPEQGTTEPPVSILLDLSDKVEVTKALVAEAEEAQAAAEQAQSTAEQALAAAKKALADFRAEDRLLAAAIAPAATDALTHAPAWIEAHPKASADDFTAKTKALEAALETYNAEAAETPEAKTLDSALPLVHAHGDFVAAGLALQKVHDDTVAAEAAAAQAAAEAEAAAAAQARANQLAPPSPNTWSGNGGGSTPPATGGGGGSHPNPGGGTSSGTGGWTPPYIPPTPCEATNTCVNNNI